MQIVRADQTAFSFRPDAAPVLRVPLGEPVRFETSAAPVERLFAAGDDWLHSVELHAVNAVAGPVFLEGVAPGDAVAVEILDVEPGDWGFTAAIPGLGLLGHSPPAPMLRRVPIRDGRVILSDRLSVPVRPMVGCLGLAPASGESSTLRPPYPWGGNYDLSQVAAGSTILFPAQVPGGLFSLGDLHAAMGTGEATSVAIECAGAANVRFGVRPGLALATPRIETADRLYTVGLDAAATPPPNGDYPAARRQAVTLMFAYLTEERGLAPDEAYALVSASVDLEFGGPAGAVVLASVPRAALD
jgi:amidase